MRLLFGLILPLVVFAIYALAGTRWALVALVATLTAMAVVALYDWWRWRGRRD